MLECGVWKGTQLIQNEVFHIFSFLLSVFSVLLSLEHCNSWYFLHFSSSSSILYPCLVEIILPWHFFWFSAFLLWHFALLFKSPFVYCLFSSFASSFHFIPLLPSPVLSLYFRFHFWAMPLLKPTFVKLFVWIGEVSSKFYRLDFFLLTILSVHVSVSCLLNLLLWIQYPKFSPQ